MPLKESLRWVAVDWGSTHVRAYAMGDQGSVLQKSHSTEGMGRMSPGDYEPALLRLIEAWLPNAKRAGGQKVLVLACGMVGARQGWREADYAEVPCRPASVAHLTSVATQDARLDVRIVAGLCQASPADVMRGEETQLLGLLARGCEEQVVCLPGTHSKWVSLVDSVVENFQTYMSGEVFSLLAEQSVLRHSVALEAWDDAAFLQAVNEAVKHPAGFLNACFGLRAKGLLHQADSAKLSASLSGWVIGCELASTKNFWRNHTVAVVGAEALAKRYREAIQSLGGVAVCHDPDQTTLAGLRQIAEELNPVFAQRKKHE